MVLPFVVFPTKPKADSDFLDLVGSVFTFWDGLAANLSWSLWKFYKKKMKREVMLFAVCCFENHYGQTITYKMS